MSPTPATSVPTPSAFWLNVWSFTRMALAVIAGLLVTAGYSNGNAPQTVGGAITIIGVAIWHLGKNWSVVQKLITALQQPAVRLLSIILVCCLIVGPMVTGCATSQVTTAAMDSEMAETTGELLYVAVASGIQTYDALPTTTAAQAASANKVWSKAWVDLEDLRALYAAGTVITVATLAALEADVASGGAATSNPAAAKMKAAIDVTSILAIIQLIAEYAPELVTLGEQAYSAYTSNDAATLNSLQSQAESEANALPPPAPSA